MQDFCHPPVMKITAEEEFVEEHSESSFNGSFILLNHNVPVITTCPHKMIAMETRLMWNEFTHNKTTFKV